MSMRSWAKAEIDRAGFEESEKQVLVEILDKFWDTWDSGGAVFAMIPVLHSLLSGRPLSALTGEDDEWNDVSEMAGGTCYQNRRCSSVFKRVVGKESWCYDLDGEKDPGGYRGMKLISFPYMPGERNLDPVVSI